MHVGCVRAYGGDVESCLRSLRADGMHFSFCFTSKARFRYCCLSHACVSASHLFLAMLVLDKICFNEGLGPAVNLIKQVL